MSRSDKRKRVVRRPTSAAGRPPARPACKRAGIALLAAAAALVVAIVYQHTRGEYQESFLRALTSGRPAEVLSLLDPSLRTRVDEAGLSAYMNTIRTNLGGVRGIYEPAFGTWTRYQHGARRTESLAVVQFEKGEAECRLILMDGLVVYWQLKSDKMPPG